MQKIFRCLCLVLVVGTTLLLGACGLKGDLYLPEGQAYEVKVG